MAVFTNAGGNGGITSDEVTATLDDVLKGKTALTSDSDDEAAEGRLELTGNAGDSQVLSGSTYYNTDAKTKRTGTMQNQGAKTASLNCGASYNIPAGYHNGSGKVTANSLASQTAGNAGAEQILSGKTAYVNGAKVTGTMPNLNSDSKITHTSDNATKVLIGDAAYVVKNSDGTTRAEIRYNGTEGFLPKNTMVAIPQGTMASAAGLTAAKLWPGNTVLGIASSKSTMGAQTITPSLSAQTVSCNGKGMTGNITINPIPNQRGQAQYGTGMGSGDGYYSINGLPEGYYVSNGASWAPEARIKTATLQSGLGITADKIVSGKSIAGISGNKHAYGYYAADIKPNQSSKNYPDKYGSSRIPCLLLTAVPGFTPVMIFAASIERNKFTAFWSNSNPDDIRIITNDGTLYAYHIDRNTDGFSIGTTVTIPVPAGGNTGEWMVRIAGYY